LWTAETDLALAGGVFVQCTPSFYQMANRAGMLSPSGRCHTFDDRADGFVPGEGVGVVVLKRLSAALAAGDHIEGVIRGTGINQDGASNGITAPSALSQERLEREVYETFGIHPEDIQMVEAHGTGTTLGDPIEYHALTRAFRKDTNKTQYCAMGSIKTNLGHTTAAAGVAGVIKVLLSLRHRQLPPSLHYERGNSRIDFANSPFYVNTTLKAWDVEDGKPRCAAVSSFGMSGTNAHLVIEEAPALDRVHAERPGYLVVVSARSEGQLRQQVEQLIAHYAAQANMDCGNVSYTLLLGRRHFNYRLACIAGNGDELLIRLRKWLEKGKAAHVYVAALQDKERREQPSLKRYGNQCIEECRALTEPDAYLEHLTTIADLYIQGYPLHFERLFAGDDYSRVSLPTYPFARERYWVEGSRESKHLLRNTEASKRPDSTRIEQLLESLITNELDEVTVIEQLRMTVTE
jgi:acyl transferase domain-containing protein